MKRPKGMFNIGKDNCIILNKCVSIKQQGSIIKKTIEILKNLGFVEGNVDPCLYIKESAKGVVYIALHVDNNIMVGNMVAIDDAISALKSHRLVLKIMEGLQDYKKALGWYRPIL